MASALSQSLCHPQVFSQLTSTLFGIRALSNQATAGRKYNNLKQETLESCQTKTDKPDCIAFQILDLSSVLKDHVHRVQNPILTLAQKRNQHGIYKHWRESHVSAQSFFENKTGFPESELGRKSCIPTLQTAVKDPLFSHILTSLAQSQIYLQRRGFKTKRGEGTLGIGVRNKAESKFLDGSADIFNFFNARQEKKGLEQPPNSIPLGSMASSTGPAATEPSNSTTGSGDGETERRINMAFTEGYKAKEELSKKRFGGLRTLLFFAFGVWLVLLIVSSSFSIRNAGGSLGFLSGTNYEVNPEEVNVSFADVKGAAEAKAELQDIVNFLRDPDRYTSIGAKLPKGVLLVGPPGVGKTLLARAVAGEASVPFFHASGSEFDEMFVGLGAKRIRQLFTAAKQSAPCIIFIDEFDSVGAKRTNSAVHPYANQTINQLLSEMDGFQQNEGIIVLGATNKVDNMDKALRRPGRFDVEVTVSLPDLTGRKEILELYISKVKKDANVDIDKLARGTTGFSGAELENLINQAALKAAIDHQETITMEHLEFARDKILMGPERKHRIPDEETNKLTAYHEAGHTLVAFYTKDATPLHKVTIIPRGQSLGHTSFLDNKEVYNKTVAQLKASMDTAMGGRAAEEIIYGTERVTTGASSDLQQATKVATAMVMSNGMSEKVGLRSFSNQEISPNHRDMIDQEIRRILQEAYDRAKLILKSHNTELHRLAEALMKYETLDKDEIQAVIEGKQLKRKNYS